MSRETVGNIPQFDGETQPKTNTGTEEVKKAPAEEAVEEKEIPSESSTEEKPAEETEEKASGKISEDTGEEDENQKQIQGLQREKDLLLKEIQDLRGQRRQIKQDELKVVEKEIDELKDINPDDIQVLDRVLKAKGYISKDDFNKNLYDQAQQEQLDKFLDKYPEFQAKNDPNDVNWNTFQAELKDYSSNRSLPLAEFRIQVGRILEKARKAISASTTDEREIQIQKQKIKLAGVGSGGSQRSSASKSFAPEKREQLSRGGFTEAEIKEMENSLS